MNASIDELKSALSAQQKKAALLINQNELAGHIDGGKKSYEEIAKEVGIDVKTLFNWRKQDRNFIAYQNAMADITLHSFREEADAMLMKLIRGGNNGLGSIKALHLYYQMTGKLVAKSETTIIDGGQRKPSLTDEEVSEQLVELNKLLN